MRKIKNNYSKHPSKALSDLFKNRSFQGQDPNEAKIIFLGLDANFASNVEETGFFSFIKEYLNDGVNFWGKYHVHHPFLLPNFPKGDGVTYHKRFSKLNLNHYRAKDISFVELLDIPTIGKTNYKQLKQLLNIDYLKKLDKILLNNSHQKILFLSKSVYNQLSKVKNDFDVFKWLLKSKEQEVKKIKLNELKMIYNDDYLKVYIHTHFSAAISDNHLKKIRDVLVMCLPVFIWCLEGDLTPVKLLSG